MRKVQISHNPDKSYILTEKEYIEAKEEWANNRMYECLRIKALIPANSVKYVDGRSNGSSEIFYAALNEGSPLVALYSYFRYRDDGTKIQTFDHNGSEVRDVKAIASIEKTMVMEEDYLNDWQGREFGGELIASGEPKKIQYL